jgi:hypothetical protein
MIPATIQPLAPCASTATALDARAPVVALSEPAWRLLGYPRGRFGPGRGHDHRLDAVQGGLALGRGGIDASILRAQSGWLCAHRQMMVQAWRPWGRLSRIALQHGVPAAAAAFPLSPPDNAPQRRRASGRPLPDHRGVRLAQTHPCLWGRHGFPREHPPRRLGHYLVGHRDEEVSGHRHSLGRLGRLGTKQGPHLLGLPPGRLRAGEPVLIGGWPAVSRGRATRPRRPHDALHRALGTARAIPNARAPRQALSAAGAWRWSVSGQAPARHQRVTCDRSGDAWWWPPPSRPSAACGRG